MFNCIYLGESAERKQGDNFVYCCQLHEFCVLENGDNTIVGCDGCKKRLLLCDSDFATKWIDPLVILDRRRNQTECLRNLLAGASVFLVGGGPSANDLPLEQLNRRGVWSLGINNVAGHSRFRANAMVCSDPPKKFSDSIWLDPTIIKFVPTAKLSGSRAKLRTKKDGKFEDIDRRIYDCPNVWAFKRWSWLEPNDKFFLTDGACWGNQDSGTKQTGEPKTVCTMLLGLRLLRYLGANKVYLVGIDFRMGSGYGYSFEQERNGGACKSNNTQFSVVNQWLVKMQQSGIFQKFGMKIFNCFQYSGLRAFPYVPFEYAIQDAMGTVVDKPDLAGWYD